MTISDIEKFLSVTSNEERSFSSTHLWRPVGNRGAFGGQLFAQLIDAALQTAPEGFFLHSFHSYFVASSDETAKIMYQVKRVRDGNQRIMLTLILAQECLFAVDW